MNDPGGGFGGALPGLDGSFATGAPDFGQPALAATESASASTAAATSMVTDAAQQPAQHAPAAVTKIWNVQKFPGGQDMYVVSVGDGADTRVQVSRVVGIWL